MPRRFELRPGWVMVEYSRTGEGRMMEAGDTIDAIDIPLFSTVVFDPRSAVSIVIDNDPRCFVRIADIIMIVY